MIPKIRKTLLFDVAVVGGGTAGAFAAISAADAGAKTVLIEKCPRLGGTAVECGVNFPGLFHAWGKQIISGPAWEAILETVRIGKTALPEFPYKSREHYHQQIRINPFVFTSVLDKMTAERGVTVMLHSILADAEETEDGIELAVAGKEGLTLIKAKNAVDATADANLTVLAGYETVKSEILQPATLAAHITGYDPDSLDFSEMEIRAKEAKEKGLLPEWVEVYEVINSLRARNTDFHIKCPDDVDSSLGKSKLEADAREGALKYIEFIRTLDGCENASVEFAYPECGVRESRRIVGEHIITAEEYLAGEVYPDAISYAFYPIDLHVRGGIKQKFLADGIVPTVPYRALIPKGSRHIIAAGRCISADTDAMSALRVEAVSMSVGQAAGVAASVASASACTISKAEIHKIRFELEHQGAIVPHLGE